MRRKRVLVCGLAAATVLCFINTLASNTELKLEHMQEYLSGVQTAHVTKNLEYHPTAISGTRHPDIPNIFYESHSNATPHDFRYTLNPVEFCNQLKRQRLHLLVVVASAAWEIERRNVIRRTWGSETSIRENNIRVLFFVGNDSKMKTYARLKKEYHKFGDIVQESYLETYRNLSLKTQGQLKWASTYCTKAEFVMHVDDDVFPDLAGIVEHLRGVQQQSREVHCAKVFKPVVRREGKWETSIDEYPDKQYPLSCVGWCFVMSSTVVKELYLMSIDTRMLHLEDVWVTGILREKIGNAQIRKMASGERLCQHLGWPKDKPTNEKILEAWKKFPK